LKELSAKTLEFIKKESLVDRGDKILVAVSGGIDSISLLYVIKELMGALDIPTPVVAHVNHNLRGMESDRDEEFVRMQAKGLGLQFVPASFNIREIAVEDKSSIQETARRYRLKFLEDTAKELNCTKIATGHNQDDLAETALMWITRGAGIKGAAGIPPKRDKFIRPLLCCSRAEIANFAEEAGIIHVEDSSNVKLDYVRNVFRHEVLPLIESKCYNSAKNNIARFAEIMRTDMDYLDGVAQELTKELVSDISVKDEKSIEVDELLSVHPALQTRVVRQTIKDIAGNLDNISHYHIEKVLEMCSKKESGTKIVSLPGNIEAVKVYSKLFIRPKLGVDNDEDDHKDSRYNVKYPGTTIIEPLSLRLDIELLAGGKAVEKYNFDDPFIAFINSDKVQLPLTARFAEQGDSFTPLGSTGSKKLSDFFIDKKIPVDERWNTPVLTDNENMIWVIGHRISELYRLNYASKNVLMIKASWL